MKDYQLERESELRIEVASSPVSVLVSINIELYIHSTCIYNPWYSYCTVLYYDLAYLWNC